MIYRQGAATAVLAGRYLLGSELGRGGMAVVYRAWDTVLHRDVAVKLLRDLLIDPTARGRFETEGELLAKLSHPGLVAVFDAGVDDDRPFLVLELVDGETLAARRAHGPMAWASVRTIGAELAAVLGYIHRQGITHRDVKPSNVLIDGRGHVRLADFGTARRHGSSHHTATGFTIGTAAYMAPEQVRGDEYGPPADIYALGLILIEALQGSPVYTGAAETAALARLREPPAVDPAWPSPVRNLLIRMTADRTELRPAADDVARILTALPDLIPISAEPAEAWSTEPPVTEPLPSGPRLSRRWLAGMSAALLVAGLASALTLTRDTTDEPRTSLPAASAPTLPPVATATPPATAGATPVPRPSTTTRPVSVVPAGTSAATATAKEGHHGKGRTNDKGRSGKRTGGGDD